MMYAQMNIHQRINAKHNAAILYPCTYSGRQDTTRLVMRRDGALYNCHRLMLRPDQVHYPKNDEIKD